jgi:hypothetical protein
VIQLAGGLGNNLFQLYGAFEIASRYEMPIKIDASRLWRDPHLRKRGRSQNEGLDLMQFVEIQARAFPMVQRSRITSSNLAFKLLPFHRFIRVWYPDGNQLGQPIETISDPEKFFALVETRVLGNFQDPALVKAAVEAGLPDVLTPLRQGEIYSQLEKTVVDPSVTTIHVRLGDYLSAPSFLRLGRSYYLSFLEKSIKLGVSRCVIFSDCPELANYFLEPLAHKVELMFIDSSLVSHVQALSLMSRAAKLCISNSSLSLFAASLNTQGHITAPDPWFKGRFPNFVRVKLNYPSGWHVESW